MPSGDTLSQWHMGVITVSSNKGKVSMCAHTGVSIAVAGSAHPAVQGAAGQCCRQRIMKGASAKQRKSITFGGHNQTPPFTRPSVHHLHYVDELLLVIHGPIDLQQKYKH